MRVHPRRFLAGKYRVLVWPRIPHFEILVVFEQKGKYYVIKVVYLIGKNVYFHTNSTYADVVCVVEIAALKADMNTGKERYASLGWSYFQPFSASKGGIDPLAVWKTPGSNKVSQAIS